MSDCEREVQKVMAALNDYVDAAIWYNRVTHVLKPTEMKSGESERAYNAFERAEGKLYNAMKNLKRCKVK